MLRFHRFSSRTPFLFEANKGGGSGGAVSIEDQLAAARDEINTSRQSITTLTRERDQAVEDRTRLQGLLDASTETASTLTAERDTARAELATAQTTISALTSERDTARTDLTREQSHVTRLEQQLGVRGVKPTDALESAPLNQGITTGLTEKEWDAKLTAAKTPQEKSKVTRDFQAAAKAGQVRQG